MDDLVQFVRENYELITIVAGVLFIYFVIYPLWLKLLGFVGSQIKIARYKIRRKILPTKTMSPEQISDAIERGKYITYRGRVSRKYHWRDTHLRTRIVRHNFEVRRYTLAMTPREREAVLLYEILDAEGELGQYADRLCFCLAWADGKCELYAADLKVDSRVAMHNGFKNVKDLITLEAGHRNATTEGALGELLALLQRATRRKHRTPSIQYLAERYRVPSLSGG